MLLVNSDFRSLNLLNRLAKLVYTLFIIYMGTLNNSIDLYVGALLMYISLVYGTTCYVCVCVSKYIRTRPDVVECPTSENALWS